MDQKNQYVVLAIVVVIFISILLYWVWYKYMPTRDSEEIGKVDAPRKTKKRVRFAPLPPRIESML